MGARATITSKGQVTVPKSVRERHNLKPGDVIEFVEENGRLWVRAKNIRAADLSGILGPPRSGKGLTIEEMNEAVMDAVAEDDKRIVREWHEGIE